MALTSGARRPHSGDDRFLSMADSVASTQSRPPRAASKKRRQATVSTETENKLARAARSAQRLAQLSGASRDDSTLDLFPDDPTRATLEAMNIDIRQGTLHGFELPDVVLAAVGAIDTGGSASQDSRSARRAPRPAKIDEPMPVNAQLSGLEIEPSASAAPQGELASDDAKHVAAADEKPATPTRDTVAPLTSAMAAATVARSVTTLRQTTESGATASGTAAQSNSGDDNAPQRPAAPVANAAPAARKVDAAATEPASVANGRASAEPDTVAAEPKPGAPAPAAQTASTAQAHAAFAAPRREAQRAEAAAAALLAAPELDRARATAFADTVDALYGVIADQRLAATDHSRRMKWMLSIVVGALLVTVAIGITQTLLLMRLTRETTAQQHRIEQLMQNQQAAMASLLDTHMAMANAAAANAASGAAVAPAASQPAAATPAHAKRAARVPHPHKPKAVNPH
jgi:hypothetical protein